MRLHPCPRCALRQVDKILLEVAGETLAQMAAAPQQQRQARLGGAGRASRLQPAVRRLGAQEEHGACLQGGSVSSHAHARPRAQPIQCPSCPFCLLCRQRSSSSSQQKTREKTCKRGWRWSEGDACFLSLAHVLPLLLLNPACCRCCLPVATIRYVYSTARLLDPSCAVLLLLNPAEPVSSCLTTQAECAHPIAPPPHQPLQTY